MPCHCAIVPPQLLDGIANSSQNSEDDRNEARVALDVNRALRASRRNYAAALRERVVDVPQGPHPGGIVPADLLRHVAESDAVDEDTRAGARRDLDSLLKQSRPDQQVLSAKKGAAYRYVYDDNHMTKLPGTLVRAEGQPVVRDEEGNAINEAYRNAGVVLKFYKDIFRWDSINDKNMDIIQTVHYGKRYQNAFWDGQQMVYGDGGRFLYNFTGSLDVIAHELSHGVTDYTSPLEYVSQSGALNEHMSDAFGIMAKHYDLQVKSQDDDWLIGEEILLPGVKGVALRSMKAPGTAYNDPRFGKDQQPANMKDYVKLPNNEENDMGGVHINSGIPNKAFYNAAIAFGGYSYETAGQIWWKARTSGQIPPHCTFQQFADITVDAAKDVGGDDAARKVRQAWIDVGVQRDI